MYPSWLNDLMVSTPAARSGSKAIKIKYITQVTYLFGIYMICFVSFKLTNPLMMTIKPLYSKHRSGTNFWMTTRNLLYFYNIIILAKVTSVSTNYT